MRGFRKPTVWSARWHRLRRGWGVSATKCRMLTPKDFRSVACPTYPEVRLSLFPYKKVESDILAFAPQALHIATEGPLGLERAALLH